MRLFANISAACALCLVLAAPAGADYARVIAGAGPGYPAKGGFTGEGGGPLSARFYSPAAVSAEPGGGLLVVDTLNQRIRRIQEGRVETVAGSGVKDDCGDRGWARDICLKAPHGVLSDRKGGFWIADSFNAKIRHVDSRGRAKTVLGGICYQPNWRCSQEGRADSVKLGVPIAVKPAPGGGLLITDAGTSKVLLFRRGRVSIVAGFQGAGFSGDGGRADRAQLHEPQDAIAYQGGVLIADGGNCRIRQVSRDGIIETIAGGGQSPGSCQAKIKDWAPGGPLMDGPALNAEIQVAAGVARRGKTIYFSDFLGGRVRKIEDGRVETIMGYLGPERVEPDSAPGQKVPQAVPALQAPIVYPAGIEICPGGKMLIADPGNSRIWQLGGRGRCR